MPRSFSFKMDIAAIISYDGTNFHGFQLQNQSRTVQLVIEKGLEKIFKERICVVPAGRTDAGVHAIGQVISFRLEKCPFSIEKLQNILNYHLPDDIRISEMKIMSGDFNSRFSAKSRVYVYAVSAKKDMCAHLNRYFWNLDISLEQLKVPLNLIPERFCFRSFSRVSRDRKLNFGTVTFSKCIFSDDFLYFIIEAPSFLWHTVRFLFGEAVAVAIGKRTLEDYKEALEGKKRLVLYKAPPKGLHLWGVSYFEQALGALCEKNIIKDGLCGFFKPPSFIDIVKCP
ncbi:tRNA pseudouridine38-40 synthase [Thermodesulfobium acidiphilum]|uniref:tRNA pseudouridine synthase A n=1 Tax=Thermodesulfobium acidiphilum TaxID=1794699 RepID=A0A2R4VZF1_THEAF|nr:tRNA pseudouridine(38-40) synthase TruA [Thermodesulfobium acidiphilum]AWB09882.1 tRNA pseudouridine38-40 synthase [Thermodesulfobium acidiphilum]